MKAILIVVASLSTAIILCNLSVVQAETLQGLVTDQNNHGIPGLTVSLVSPSTGRSSPSITDALGRYFFDRIPRVSTPYYIEVYWGRQLFYRNTVPIVGNIQLPPIILRR
jgi:Carboxypeptidase regulatory-like domain